MYTSNLKCFHVSDIKPLLHPKTSVKSATHKGFVQLFLQWWEQREGLSPRLETQIGSGAEEGQKLRTIVTMRIQAPGDLQKS